MAEMTQEISFIPLLKHRNTVINFPEDQDEFVTKYEATNDHLSHSTVPELNEFRIQANNLRLEVNTLRDDTNNIKNTTDGIRLTTLGYRDDALEYKNSALAYRNDAVEAKEAIDGYVVPTNATYTPEQIDSKISNIQLERFLDFKF